MIIFGPKTTCPYCFGRFYSSDVHFKCDKCKKDIEPPKEISMKWLSKDSNPIKKNHRWIIWGDTANCPDCGLDASLMRCPKCKKPVPTEMVKHKSVIISIIGARSSGKTVYITTLINELKRRGEYLGNIAISAVNIDDTPTNYTSNRYDEWYKQLYINSQLPAPTAPGDPRNEIPLIYEIRRKNANPTFLVFYDTAGENFNNVNNIAAKVQFLKSSDAIIFLLDTMQISHVQKVLGISTSGGQKFDGIFDNILTYFNQSDPKAKKQCFNKSIAFVFSKIDAILDNEAKFKETSIANMSMGKDSYFINGEGVSLAEFDSIDNSIKGALKAWDEYNFLNNVDIYFKNAKYFGISALGSNPTPNRLAKPVSPYRVLDPLVWLLHEQNFPLPIKQE